MESFFPPASSLTFYKFNELPIQAFVGHSLFQLISTHFHYNPIRSYLLLGYKIDDRCFLVQFSFRNSGFFTRSFGCVGDIPLFCMQIVFSMLFTDLRNVKFNGTTLHARPSRSPICKVALNSRVNDSQETQASFWVHRNFSFQAFFVIFLSMKK